MSNAPSMGQGVDATPLVQGITQICSGGTASSLYASESAWSVVVGGDDDGSFPSSVAMARTYGTGRIVVLGHESFFGNALLLDNLAFQQNLVRWLNAERGKRVRFTAGHSERLQSTPSLSSVMAVQGYSFGSSAAAITPDALSNVDVLVVGNAWDPVAPAEVEAVRAWVDAGGGLMLLGLGWSYPPYNPGSTLHDYPMTVLAAPYGIRWNDDYVSDPTNNIDGSAVFRSFYPNVVSYTLPGAMAEIAAMHSAHPTDLASALQTDPVLGRRFARAHQTLSLPPHLLATLHADRQDVYDFLITLTHDRPGFYARTHAISQTVHPVAVWTRERTQRSLADALPLSPDRRSEVADALGMSDARRELLLSNGLVLADNNRCDGPQLAAIAGLLREVPSELHDLRQISVTDYLGQRPAAITLAGEGFGVNVFGVRVGSASENQFPADAPPNGADLFSVVCAHEINHVVDAHGVERSPTLRQRKQALLNRAGVQDLEYLRSMVGGQYFQDNPQEFFASLANQWFTDSDAVFDLALSRFDRGYHEPINQALFFADVYSRGGSKSLFYRTTPQGSLSVKRVQVRRNASGYIDWVRVRNRGYRFVLDETGFVTGYALDCSLADVNGAGGVTIQDVFDFLGGWFAGDELADFNGVNGVTLQDLFDFLSAYFGGCV